MRTINTKFGPLYIEDYGNPRCREEADRLKIYDSRKRYLDYFSVESLEENAAFKNIAPEELLEQYIVILEHAQTVEDLLDQLGLNCVIATCDEVLFKTVLLEWDFSIKDYVNNEWVNFIGEYYVLIADN